jgi:hypothetical protein
LEQASDLIQLGNEPIKVRGEKEWQAWAQDLNDWSDGQTNAANTRIPYQSALLQTMNDPIKVRGEKEWQAWAQDLNDWSDGQTDAANTRIQYQSALVQTSNEPIAVRGEKEWQAWAQDLNDWSDGQTNAANGRIPYQSTVELESDEMEDEEAGGEKMSLSQVPHDFKLIAIKGAEEGDELIKIEDANTVPRNFRF